MNCKKRIRLEIIIGIPVSVAGQEQLADLGDDICMAISAVSAGCTLSFCEGFWSLDGDKFLPAYDNIEKQRNIKIHVTVLEDKKDVTLKALKTSLETNPIVKTLNINSVHIELYPLMTQHISL